MVFPHRPLSVITSPSRGRNCFPQTSRNHLVSPPRSPSALTDTSQTLALTRLVSPISRPLQEVSRRLRRLENQGFRIAGIPGENPVTSAGKTAGDGNVTFPGWDGETLAGWTDAARRGKFANSQIQKARDGCLRKPCS